MRKFDSPLNNIKIASPCSANWEEMYGNERKRFCGDCNLNVYNLSGMTKYDAENLLMSSEGRVCVRYFERSDGTVLTADCPVGWAKVKQRLSVCTTAIFSLFIALAGGLLAVSMLRRPTEIVRRLTTPFTTPTPLMGAIAMPTPSPTPNPTPTPDKKPEGWIVGEVARPADVPVGKFSE